MLPATKRAVGPDLSDTSPDARLGRRAYDDQPRLVRVTDLVCRSSVILLSERQPRAWRSGCCQVSFGLIDDQSVAGDRRLSLLQRDPAAGSADTARIQSRCRSRGLCPADRHRRVTLQQSRHVAGALLSAARSFAGRQR